MATIYKYEKWTKTAGTVYHFTPLLTSFPQMNGNNGSWAGSLTSAYPDASVNPTTGAITLLGTPMSVGSERPIGEVRYVNELGVIYRYIRETASFNFTDEFGDPFTVTVYWKKIAKVLQSQYKDTFVEYVYAYDKSLPYDGLYLDGFYYIRTNEIYTPESSATVYSSTLNNTGYAYNATFTRQNMMVGKSTTYIVKGFVLMPGVPIPQGAEIVAAMLEVKPAGDKTTAVNLPINIYAANQANPVAPTTLATLNAVPLTTNYQMWDAGYDAWSTSVKVQTTNFKNVIQEIVNRVDWSPDNNMMIMPVASSSVASSTNRLIAGGSTLVLHVAWKQSQIQIGTFPFMGKTQIINIPLYDPNTGMDGKNMYRAFTADGKVGCFNVQDITGNELIRLTGKTKIRGIKR